MKTYTEIERTLLAGIDARFWYEETHRNASVFCREYNKDLTEFVTIVALLSPRTNPTRNAELAINYSIHGSTEGIMGQRINAIDKYRSTGMFGGPKVRNFRDSILLVDGAVCVDIWVSRAFGYKDGELMKTTKEFTRKRETASRIIRRLAKSYDMTSYGAQSCIWVGYLRRIGRMLPRHNAMEFAPTVSQATCYM